MHVPRCRIHIWAEKILSENYPCLKTENLEGKILTSDDYSGTEVDVGLRNHGLNPLGLAFCDWKEILHAFLRHPHHPN